MTTTTTPIDLAAIKARQRTMWASGDYSTIAAALPIISERLVDSAELVAGTRVLDVAGGTGNAALAAARLRCEVVCTDYVPELLERARERALAERLEMEIREADAEELPFAPDSFDAVVSAIGVMFTADHSRAASELLRVCRPGGTIALASWTPDGFVGEMLRLVGSFAPPPPGVAPATRWGTEDGVSSLLGHGVERVTHRLRRYTFRFRSAEEFVQVFLDTYGPTNRAFAALDGHDRASMHADFVALVRRHDVRDAGGAVAVPASYLESVAISAS